MQKFLLGEMSSFEIQEYLKKGGKSVLVPIGSCEQHGSHLPLSVDVIIPYEICKRLAPKINALVAPPINYGLSEAHLGSGVGAVWITGKALLGVVEDIAISLAKIGFKRIAFVNGHYCNDPLLFVACSDITGTGKVPDDTKVFGFSYWHTLTPEEGKKYLGWDAGWHANIGETSVVLAIRPDLVDMSKAPKEMPTLAKTSLVALNAVSMGTGIWRYVVPGTGIWGDATKSSKEKGEEYLSMIMNGMEKAWKDTEDAFKVVEERQSKS